EPQRLITALDGTRPSGGIERVWAKVLRRRLRGAGLTVPDQVFGLAWSGALTAERLLGLLEGLPPGLTEIYAHPALGPYPGSAPGYRYAEELEALIDPLAKAAIHSKGVQTGRFADFALSRGNHDAGGRA
ncbi:MAG: PTS cellobiose transporter, partial [Novosphingobium sp.]|nr:PTS cellobiose transporter [Novosphingobium sp.]